MLAERDENIKTVTLEKARLELEAQGFAQRLRSLDESEQRYKDENWSLETQTHDLIAAAKEGASREQRLQQSLAISTAEKTAAQRELDDIKQAHGKLIEDHTLFRKNHDAELVGLRKNLVVGETERGSMLRKIEELTSQNQELAKAVAGRFRNEDDLAVGDIGSDPEELSLDRSDTDHSPPPSPSKGILRHSMLESETLKSSLQHAHSMIQNLKRTVHREKTEKLELKRLLQESRDELEVRRNDSNGGTNNKRPKPKSQLDLAKKKSTQLGMGRSTRTDIEIDDPGWEDGNGGGTPTLKAPRPPYADSDAATGKLTDMSDAYQTANETEAFETANERDTSTETDAFQTGNEDLAGESSDELTETETVGNLRATTRASKVLPLAKAGNRESFVSTASTSESENGNDQKPKTPVHTQSQRFKLKLNHRGNRRSRVGSEGPSNSIPPSMDNSPASFISNNGPQGQNLFDELGGLSGQGSDEEMDGTPSRSNPSHSIPTTPGSRPPTAKLAPSRSSPSTTPPVPAIPMVHTGMMTEPWEPAKPVEVEQHRLVGNDVQSTPQTKDAGVQRTPATSTPKPKDQSLAALIGNIPTFPTTSTPKSSLSREVAWNETSAAVRVAEPALAFSEIKSLETAPIAPVQDMERPKTASQETSASETPALAKEAGKAGVFGSVLGWAQRKRGSAAEDEAPDVMPVTATAPEVRTPFKEVPANIMTRESSKQGAESSQIKAAAVNKADQSSQTILSADQIDSLLASKAAAVPSPSGNEQRTTMVAMKPLSDIGATTPPLQRDQSQETMPARQTVAPLPGKSTRRPGSAGSMRTPVTTNFPPLPSDHREAIAAASQQAPVEMRPSTAMGPPTIPASAYRSSIKPQASEPRPASRASGTTPRPRYSTARSQRSRRSSVSSFASELDERFNIRTDEVPPPQGTDNGTDPRMIQAITQTMIGEYLWKYTRKAGRGEMSAYRHRRFFWVHPYTRTLYWSEQDPSTAGRAQLKAKSVAIDAVQVVIDDNHVPAGLHRKSLVIITPGRSIKFTATTGQRHETWFNALSYLLIRAGPEAQHADGSGLTAEDVAEFNPSYANSTGHRTAGSRISLSSYNSRTNTRASSRGASPIRAQSAMAANAYPTLQHASITSRMSGANQGSISSRLSSYWKTPGRGSVSSRQSASNVDGIYNASVVHDSAEDVRKVLEEQEAESDRLENVRACCDGKVQSFLARGKLIWPRKT
jgi:hypothetical protein